MILKWLAIFAVLLAISQAPRPLSGQTVDQSGDKRETLSTSSADSSQSAGTPSAKSDCEAAGCGYPQPRITVANPVPVPAPTPAPWTLYERIAWGANVALAVLGYVGIMLAISTLKKIERQVKSVEAITNSAVDAAQTALLNSEASVRAERPWILISVEPSPGIQDSFHVVATNRGRSPAQIISMAEQIKFAADEKYLPAIPEYEKKETNSPHSQGILLPGEFFRIKTISRQDLKEICPSEEMFRRVENWEEKVYVHGRIIYKELTAPRNRAVYETAWCCWYIHGQQRSGLVISGPDKYNQHT